MCSCASSSNGVSRKPLSAITSARVARSANPQDVATKVCYNNRGWSAD
jgi:hypothetical protein